jgi:hypothetical protein
MRRRSRRTPTVSTSTVPPGAVGDYLRACLEVDDAVLAPEKPEPTHGHQLVDYRSHRVAGPFAAFLSAIDEFCTMLTMVTRPGIMHMYSWSSFMRITPLCLVKSPLSMASSWSVTSIPILSDIPTAVRDDVHLSMKIPSPAGHDRAVEGVPVDDHNPLIAPGLGVQHEPAFELALVGDGRPAN